MVAGGHMTASNSSIPYSSVVSRESVIIALTIAALNGLSILWCDIQNAYLTAPCQKKIWMTAGTEFGSTPGKKMLLVRVLYGLKLSGAAFRVFLAEALYDLGYNYSVADHDVWLRPAIKDKKIQVLGIRFMLCGGCIVHKRKSDAHHERHTTKVQVEG